MRSAVFSKYLRIVTTAVRAWFMFGLHYYIKSIDLVDKYIKKKQAPNFIL